MSSSPFGQTSTRSRNMPTTVGGGGRRTSSAMFAPPPLESSHYSDGGGGEGIDDARSQLSTNEQVVEANKVKWAWSMDSHHQPIDHLLSADGRALLPSSGGGEGGTHQQQLQDSSVRADLMDVVRLISTATIQTQTQEASYTQTLGNVKMEADGIGRSIAVQAGTQLQRATSGMQVVEADLADDGNTHNKERDAFGDHNNDEPMLTVGPVSSMHSAYLPTCNVPSSMYPVFMNDARALGISNRYGYIALPKPPVELPPRRRVKVVNPTEYSHLYGAHAPQLDEHTGRQLHRAHGLWTSQCGFKPNY